MNLPFTLRAAAAVASLAIAGCGSQASPPASPGGLGVSGAHARPAGGERGAASPEYPTTSPLLYTVNSMHGVVDIYEIKALHHNPAPIATISSGISFPMGLARDDVNGDLYVSDVSSGAVLIFPKGATVSNGSITDGILLPVALSLSPSRELWVSNDSTNVTVYPHGRKTPSKTISGLGCPFGSAFDASGDFFVADFCNLQVYEVRKGSSTPAALNLSGVGEPVGVTIDGAGNLWVSDASSAKVYVFKKGSKTPFQTIGGFTLPYILSTDRAGQVFVSDDEANDVVEFAPGSYTPEATLTNGVSGPLGVLARP